MNYAEFWRLAQAMLGRAERPLTVREIEARVWATRAEPPRDWETGRGRALGQRLRADPARFGYDRRTARWWLRRPAPPPDPGAAMLRATGYGEARGPF